MSDDILSVIAKLEERLAGEVEAVNRTKRMINELAAMSGQPERYPLQEATRTAHVGAIRADQFYGQPLAAAVREILEMRKAANRGPATVGELFESLKAGGFNFETKNEDNAKRGLRISLSKNAVTFHKLPNGQYGLTVWYPTIRPDKKARRTDGEVEATDTDSEGTSEEA